jgi:hypothetical protein
VDSVSPHPEKLKKNQLHGRCIFRNLTVTYLVKKFCDF